MDIHHTIEDVGIVLGTAIKEAAGEKKGIVRYGTAILPMDEALLLCPLDLCGRRYLGWDVTLDRGIRRRSGNRDDKGIFLCSFLQRSNEPPSSPDGRLK